MFYCVTISTCNYDLYINPLNLLQHLKLFMMDMNFAFLKFV